MDMQCPTSQVRIHQADTVVVASGVRGRVKGENAKPEKKSKTAQERQIGKESMQPVRIADLCVMQIVGNVNRSFRRRSCRSLGR
jgi:hypothetical protein